jgi:hypothetical protein
MVARNTTKKFENQMSYTKKKIEAYKKRKKEWEAIEKKNGQA